MVANFYNGKRLSFDGQLCTVRYQGEVQGTKGEWLGVEWDDPTRGKHSGEHGGVKYFECVSTTPCPASFVRPTRKADAPRSFVEALKAKYASEDFEDPDVEVVFATSDPKLQPHGTIRISGKEVEQVGFDKIRKQLADLHELKIVILDGLCMSRPAVRLERRQTVLGDDAWPVDLKDVVEACPKVIELDLSRNLFEEWREVASICEQLDKLKSLRADGNRFRDTTVTEAERLRCLKAFANIKALKLEETLLPWEEMTTITSLFPALTSFDASSNAYNNLTDHFLTSTITDLTFEENAFSALSNLNPIARLPNLQRLVLKSNKISDIATGSRPAPVFSPTVKEVDLSFNEISTWSFIDRLIQVFPGLTSLRVSQNPLYRSLQAADGRALSAEDGYMLTIARIGSLKMLNYSPITDKERLNAESYYLSLIARELSFAPKKLEDQIIANHPRYKELCEEYGDPVVKRESNAINPNSLAARLMRLTFYLAEDVKVSAKRNESKLEIPISYTAYALLGIIGRHFEIAPAKCRMIWETGDWLPGQRADGGIQDSSDSENSLDSDDDDKAVTNLDRVMREVEIIPGTRGIGTWIDGMDAVIRVEIK